MKLFYRILPLLFIISCIPIKIAPSLKEGKVLKAKKFVKQLGNRYVFAFEDPKNANEFYYYINAKYQVSYDDSEGNIPVIISDKKTYLTFYEINKETQTINLIPLAVDAALENKGRSPILHDVESSRSGKWYIVLTVTNEAMQDCLRPSYSSQKEVVAYLENLQKEYMSTSKYLEVYLKAE